MDNSLIQIVGAVLMIAVTVGLVVTWRRYQASNSERRMLTMLESVGLDPAIASSGDLNAIMDEVRKRCRHCQSEDVCERWLKGEEIGDNDFCPNSRVFKILGKHSIAAGS